MQAALTIKDKMETGKVLKAAPFRKEVRKTAPHKHNNYFEIIYLSQGSGFHSIDGNKYAITPPVMFFVRQEQVHCWELHSEPDGYVVIIRKAFVEKSLDKELRSLIAQISRQCCLQVVDNSVIETLLELLTKEHQTTGDGAFQVTEALLKALLAKVLQVAKPVIDSTPAKADLYHAFLQLMNADAIARNSVAYYAAQLHTSPQNLNAACRKAVQKTASEVLSDFIIIEAKRLLLYTDQTVSEISFTLHFTDPSHFVKYFKKAVGCTPQAFRLAVV